MRQMLRKVLCSLGIWHCDPSQVKQLGFVSSGMRKLYICACGRWFKA